MELLRCVSSAFFSSWPRRAWHPAALAEAAHTTRIETRPYYGAVVTIEHGVRVYRPVPPTQHLIVNPDGMTPLQLNIGRGAAASTSQRPGSIPKLTSERRLLGVPCLRLPAARAARDGRRAPSTRGASGLHAPLPHHHRIRRHAVPRLAAAGAGPSVQGALEEALCKLRGERRACAVPAAPTPACTRWARSRTSISPRAGSRSACARR